MQLTEGLNVADRFRLVRELGRGGMGSVWLAEHTRLDALCAVKFIDREGRNNGEVRRRFHHEAKAAAQLRSPHVVQILDHGEWENIPYIAMEYLEGEDLAHRLHRVGRLSWGETCRIASHVARALAKAHAAGIVHRDVKPENIFLVRDDDSEIAKVLDFGIAQQAAADTTATQRAILGTPFYMSPEQASGALRVDHRSDLFSLAVIVYQCLTGELPFVGNGVKDVFAQILYGTMPVPSTKAADLPPSFDAWWARAIARDVSQRFQTAKEFAESLNFSLRISEVLEVSSLIPHADVSSTGRISLVAGPLRALGSAQQLSGGPTLAIQQTLDESYSRTFDPGPVFRKRKIGVIAGAGAVVALGLALLVTRGREGSAAASPVPPTAFTTIPNTAPPPPEVPVVTATPSALPAAAPRVETKLVTNTNAVIAGRPVPKAHGNRTAPRRIAKPAKPRTDDFGI